MDLADVRIVDEITPMGRYIVRSQTNRRENNEDSFQVYSLLPPAGAQPIAVLAIADGMGGHAFGEHASRETLRKISMALFERLSVEPSINRSAKGESIGTEVTGEALIGALEQANAHVQRMVLANKWGRAGATVVVAVILGDRAVVANLGDSPLFHCSASTGRLTKVTQDHTVAGVLLQAGLISPEMARFHEGRSQLEFYVGCPKLPSDSPLYHITLAFGDRLLLCSDGVTGHLQIEQVEAIMTAGNDLELVADHLLLAAVEAGETDNQTLILWHHVGTESEETAEMSATITGTGLEFDSSAPDSTTEGFVKTSTSDNSFVSGAYTDPSLIPFHVEPKMPSFTGSPAEHDSFPEDPVENADEDRARSGVEVVNDVSHANPVLPVEVEAAPLHTIGDLGAIGTLPVEHGDSVAAGTTSPDGDEEPDLQAEDSNASRGGRPGGLRNRFLGRRDG